MCSIEKKILKKYGRVHTGWASRFQSDRFLNPNQAVCPLSMNRDTAGRAGDEYSLTREIPGCTSAMDRIQVENAQRPSNTSKASISAYGIHQPSLPVSRYALGQPVYDWAVADSRGLYNQLQRDEQWKAYARRLDLYKRMSGF